MRKLRILAALITPALCGCTSFIFGLHEITDYRAEYGAASKGIDTSHIHKKEIMAGLRSPQERPEETSSSKCVFALAISGGGSISAAFSYGVLREIAEWDDVEVGGTPISLISQIDYISTASGGGITGAILAGTFWEKEIIDSLNQTPFSPANFNQKVQARFDSEDYKATFSERYLATKDLIFMDGQGRLERFRKRLPIGVFGLNYQKDNCEAAITFHDMFARQTSAGAEGTRDFTTIQTYAQAQTYAPVWIPNATSFADGTRVPLTSAVMQRLRVTGVANQSLPCQSKSFADWPMSEALSASMSFPGIGPYRLKSELGILDLVDGGLSDNLGVLTALDVVQSDMESSPQDDRHGLIVVIDSSTDAEGGMFAGKNMDVADSEYLLEYGKTLLLAQYPLMNDVLTNARRWGVESVFVRARDLRDDGSTMSICSGLLPKSPKVPGAPMCPDETRPRSVEMSRFVRDQRTSAAIDYAHADGLMQLGRKAAQNARGSITTAIKSCVK